MDRPPSTRTLPLSWRDVVQKPSSVRPLPMVEWPPAARASRVGRAAEMAVSTPARASSVRSCASAICGWLASDSSSTSASDWRGPVWRIGSTAGLIEGTPPVVLGAGVAAAGVAGAGGAGVVDPVTSRASAVRAPAWTAAAGGGRGGLDDGGGGAGRRAARRARLRPRGAGGDDGHGDAGARRAGAARRQGAPPAVGRPMQPANASATSPMPMALGNFDPGLARETTSSFRVHRDDASRRWVSSCRGYPRLTLMPGKSARFSGGSRDPRHAAAGCSWNACLATP